MTDFSEKPVLFSGTSYPELASDFARRYGIEEGKLSFSRFPDGEINLEVEEPAVFDRDCLVFQTLCAPVQSHLMEMFLAGDALRNAGAARIGAVIPYLCYMRQDRRTTEQGPISISLIARLLKAAGYSSVRTWGLHNSAIEGAFANSGLQMLNTQTHINCKHFRHALIHNMELQESEKLVLVSPDAGAAKNVIKLVEELTKTNSQDNASVPQKMLEIETAFAYKLRAQEGAVEILDVSGRVKEKTCVIIDDIIDGGSTICEVARMLKKKGAKKVLGCVIHSIFSGNALEKLILSPMDKIITSNTVPWWKRDHFTKAGDRIPIPEIKTDEFCSRVAFLRQDGNHLDLIMRHFRLHRQNTV